MQQTLQSVQKPPEGWALANQLLYVDSLDCKFFGALTYTVNINMALPSLTVDRKRHLLWEIVMHAVNLVKNHGHHATFVVRKMFSNMGLCYLHCYDIWQNPVDTLLLALADNRAELYVVLSSEEVSLLLHNLSGNSLQMVLLFAQIMAEELIRIPLKERVALDEITRQKTFSSVSQVLSFTYGNSHLINSWIECVQAWIQYVSCADFNSLQRYDTTSILYNLFSIIPLGGEHCDHALEASTEILETDPSILKLPLRELVESIVFSGHVVGETDVFVKFAVSYISTLPHGGLGLLKSADSKIQFLMALTDCSQDPLSEEMASSYLLAVWCSLAESFADKEVEFSPAETATTKEIFFKVAVVYWKKAHFQLGDEFASFRRECADYFDAIYPTLGIPLVKHLTDNVLQSYANFADLETSLYLFNSIACNFSEPPPEISNCMSSVLSSQLFELPLFQDNQLVYTVTQFLSVVDYFYKTRPEFLSPVLGFLVTTMLRCPPARLTASKAISSICSDCREFLVSMAPDFESLVFEMIADPTVLPLIRDRITYAYGSILEASQNPPVQAARLSAILNSLEQSSLEPVAVLGCVCELGKGFRAEADVDLSEDKKSAVEKFWLTDSFQSRISVLLYSSAEEDPQVMEKKCCILKIGLVEAVSGPFVFGLETIMHFLDAKLSTSSNNLPFLLQLASSAVCAYSSSMAPDAIFAIIQKVNVSPETDPDVVESFVSFLATILDKRPSLLISQPDLSFLSLCLACTGANERFVVKTGSEFWCKLISSRRGSKDDRETVNKLFVDGLGQSLTSAVMGFLLKTQRSNVRYFAEIIKLLIAKQPMGFKKWLQNFFLLNPVDKCDIFISKVMLTRGTRKCNSVVDDFWAQQTGLTYN